MKAIYEPKGKALEYGNLACNLYRGCGHGCTYCYAPAILRMDRQEFYNNPQPREGIIEALKKDAKRIGDKYKEKIRVANSAFGSLRAIERTLKEIYIQRPEVFLCFTTDPYQPINEKYQLTRQAIEILHENEIAVNILTKGKITDFDLLAKRPDLSKVGVTYTGNYDITIEPIKKDLQFTTADLTNIDEAINLDIETWVSIEPILDTENVYNFLRNYAVIFDEIKLGKWNYDPRAKDIDWHKFVNEAIKLLERLNCKYYIKEDLRKYV